MISRLFKVKEIMKEYYEMADCGIYKTRNIVGDTLFNLYNEKGITLDICPYWSYYEIFGLTDEEWAEIQTYYYTLKGDE